MNRDINSKYFAPLRILGLMSGTSLDGLDLALCEFWRDEEIFHYQIIQAQTFEYSKDIITKLRYIFDSNALAFCQVEVEFSNFMAQCVNQLLGRIEKKPHYLASHGHTVFHQPERGLTKQIGSGAILAAKTGIPTICDFRTTDVALEGQGAPLVPIGDKLLFPQYDGCLNLGGIANISRYNSNTISAYDISLCNIPLNFLSEKYGFDYDKNGTLAQKGNINPHLLNKLNQPEYFLQQGAKSIGFEFFANFYLPLLENTQLSVEDKLRTVCEHIATQIVHHLKELKTVLVTGGGAKNSFLINLIKEKTDTQITIPEEQLIEFKEALIFAFLGYLRVNEENNCLHEVTGAKRDSCGGAIYI